VTQVSPEAVGRPIPDVAAADGPGGRGTATDLDRDRPRALRTGRAHAPLGQQRDQHARIQSLAVGDESRNGVDAAVQRSA